MRIILFSDGHFGCGATYKEAYARLDEAENGPPDCRKDGDLEPPKPIGMVITDDDNATVDDYGNVCYKYGSWTISVPMEKDSQPSANHWFKTMQKDKDDKVEKEVWDYRYGQNKGEFKSYLEPLCAECEKKKCYSDFECFKKWWEKYKKPEKEKEDSNDQT